MIFDAYMFRIFSHKLRHAEMFPRGFLLTGGLYLELLNHRLLVSLDVP